MRILIVDDHPLMREALALSVQAFAPGTDVQNASDLEAAIGAIDRTGGFDLALLDLGLPGCSGLEALASLRARCPDQAVVVVSGTEDPATVIAALDAGAMGFIPKKSPRPVLMGALRLILDGGIYVPPHVVKSSAAGVAPDHDGESAPSKSAAEALTERQLETLHLLLQGLSNKQIARRLKIAESTVKIHVGKVLQHFGVATRTQAIIRANAMGLKFPGRSS